MKKVIAIVLSALLLGAIFAAPASAALNVSPSVSVHKGFAKNGADYFEDLKKAYPDMTFSAENNSQFTINPSSGKLTFKTGLPSILPVSVTVVSGDETAVVKVTTYYEWYEYFVIVFAAGLFWIAAVNN